jgi:protein TonB
MTLEARRVPEDGFGSLRGCLVEGDPQSEKRASRIRRRAVAVSIVLQTLALTALVLFPLLSKGERISFQYVTPIPPYAPAGDVQHSATPRHPSHPPAPCRICPPRVIPLHIVTSDPNPTGELDERTVGLILGAPSRDGIIGGNDRTAPTPEAPREERVPVRTERVVVTGSIQMAQLISRVEPAYPPLARQIHREGRVELHAIISVEGRIESLEVISGDPFFIQSALAAVRQWRYRPTILNGRPVEVDTHITVIYTLSH